MPSEPSLAGYFLLLAFIFLPGVGFGELLSTWRRESGLAERVGLAFGIGLAVDTLLLMLKTSGIGVLGLTLRGIDASTVAIVMLIGVAALSISLVTRKKFSFPVRPGKADLVVLSLLLFQALLLLSYFAKYPIFPEYESQDFAAHVHLAQGLVSGSVTSVPSGLLYYGVHFQLAASLILAGGFPLVTLQRTMALLVVLSPLLVYAVTTRLFAGKGPALVTTAIYSVSGTIWFPSVFGSGLFPNFFGILSSLFLLAVVFDLVEDLHSTRVWVLFGFTLVMVYFSHYTTITLFPALLVLPVVKFLKSRSGYGRLAIPGAVTLVPSLLAFAAFPSLPERIIRLGEAGGGNVIGQTALSSALAGIPVISYMALEVTDDVAFVLLVVFAAICVYRLRHTDNLFLFVPPVWLLALLLTSPSDVSAWRFSFEALVPLTLMAGYGLYSVVPKLHFGGKGKTTGYAATAIVLFLLLTPILATSWGEISLSDSLTNTQMSASAQQDVYTALGWLQNNTPSNSTYLSVSDWRFTYSSLFFKRETYYEYIQNPLDAVNLAREEGYSYIIVTNLVTLSLPPNPSLFPWNTYEQSSNLTLKYSNSDVRVFQVT